MCLKNIGLRIQKMSTILGSTINEVGGGGGGEEDIRSFNGHNHFQSNIAWNIHMNSQNCEGNGYKHDMDWEIISH